MKSKEFPPKKTEEEKAHEKLMRHIIEGTCPECGNSRVFFAAENPSSVGFCSDSCRKKHELHDPSMQNFRAAKEDVWHQEYLTEWADKIGMPVKEFEALRKEGYSPKEIKKIWANRDDEEEEPFEMKKAA